MGSNANLSAPASRKAIGIFLCVALMSFVGCSGGNLAGSNAPFPPLDNAAPEPEDPDINLENYVMTFNEDFDEAVDVSAGECTTRWIAHTPWNGDFGAARFSDPVPGFPFRTKKGLLRIEASDEGGWKSGLLSSHNKCGGGFDQKFGYFEIRTKLPAGVGYWPAFWLIGSDRSRFTAEIDVFEHHGVRPNQFSTTIHVHPRVDDVTRILASGSHTVEEGLLYRGFNTFGVSVEDDFMVFFLNRKEIWRTPTGAEFKQPLFILLNLGLEPSEVSEATPSPAYMYVDYVRAYMRKDSL